MTTNKELGEIEPVDISSLWGSDLLEFARWLSENLQLLGEPLHMDLELVRLEPPVRGGWFWFNILAKEFGSHDRVAIVPQQNRSAHNSFGSLIGYAARHDVRTLIWVAPNFRQEHYKALEWLNEWTSDDVEVYGVNVRAIKIGDSLPAHEFRPVVFGSAYAKRARQAASGMTPGSYQRFNFYQPLVERLWRERFTNRTTAQATETQSFPAGIPGISYNAGFSWDKAMVYLWISAGEFNKSVRIYDALCQYRAELESELPDLQFDMVGQHGGWKRVSAGMVRDGSLNAPDDVLDEIRSWMFDNLIALKTAFQPRLETVMRELQAAEDAATESENGEGTALSSETDTPARPTNEDGDATVAIVNLPLASGKPEEK